MLWRSNAYSSPLTFLTSNRFFHRHSVQATGRRKRSKQVSTQEQQQQQQQQQRRRRHQSIRIRVQRWLTQRRTTGQPPLAHLPLFTYHPFEQKINCWGRKWQMLCVVSVLRPEMDNVIEENNFFVIVIL